MSSIKEVAKYAGVSVTTVSLVLNNKGNISESTRQRVLDAVDALGYTRSIRARNLRTQQSRIIGYAQSSVRGEFNPLLDHFLYDLVEYIEASERHLMLFRTSDARPLEAYQELINSERVDGFVLSYTLAGDQRFGYLHDADIPFVAFGRSLTEFDELTHWVDVDGKHGIYAATEHLIQQGHERIAFIGWPRGSASGDLRFAGFQAAMDDSGLTVQPGLIFRTENYIHNGYAVMESLMAMDNPPTAVVAVSDALAIGVIQHMNRHQERVALTGFDDIPTASYTYPPLTTVSQPIEQVASLLVDMLVAQFEDRPVAQMQHVLKPKLIIRESSTLAYGKGEL